jgi:hypothetical protein
MVDRALEASLNQLLLLLVETINGFKILVQKQFGKWPRKRWGMKLRRFLGK